MEWVLLTDRPIESVDRAWELVGWYECRREVDTFPEARSALGLGTTRGWCKEGVG